MSRIVISFAVLTLLAGTRVAAQTEPKQDAADLAKQLSNPVASLVSVPFQTNWDFGVGPGPENDTRFLLNFQPVMPFALNKDWNLIARVIVPYLSQPPLSTGGSSASGIGDLLVSGFISPAQPKKFIWGIGPALSLPVAAEPTLGSGQWAGGPTGLILKQSGHWTYGALASQVWSYAGDGSRPGVSQLYLQPFGSYTTAKATTFNLSSETTANWNASSGNTWTVPIIVQVSQLLRLGRRPISVGLAYGNYVESPDGGPNWKLRASLTLLFPK
jgi:hypothetical protein